jgi:hypothetical protein
MGLERQAMDAASSKLARAHACPSRDDCPERLGLNKPEILITIAVLTFVGAEGSHRLHFSREGCEPGLLRRLRF